MKKVVSVLVMVFCCIAMLQAKEFTTKQKQLRTNIVSFLKTEGYMPEIDSDGDIKFKSEGSVYYVIIDAKESSPFYLSLVSIYSYDDSGKWSRRWFEGVASEINLYKGLSLELYSSTAYLSMGLFLTEAEHFNRSFYRMLQILKTAENELRETDSGSSGNSGYSASFAPEHAVDLGLSVLWADRNIGASSPSDQGGYFAWGETRTKYEYSWSTYSHFTDRNGNGTPLDENSQNEPNELAHIGDNIAGTRYDAAAQNWGNGWQLPTEAQFNELINKCTWRWTSQNGQYGYRITGPNGNSIFLPAAGEKHSSSLIYENEECHYWTATNDGSDNGAYYFGGSSDSYRTSLSYNFDGLTIRAVHAK